MPDGSKWDVPASVIAANRANYYERDEPGIFQEEYDITMRDNGELAEWSANDMDWDDVKEHAVRVIDTLPPDYQDGWVNGEKEVIEK